MPAVSLSASPERVLGVLPFHSGGSLIDVRHFPHEPALIGTQQTAGESALIWGMHAMDPPFSSLSYQVPS